MNKKIKVTAATTAVAAILLTTNNVKAEEGTIETPNTDVTTTAIAKEVTKEDVINAEQTYNKVTAELKTAEDNAEKAKEIVRDLQNKEIELSTEIKEAETITPDKLKEAEHSIAKLGTKQEETEAALMLVNAQVEEVKQEKDARILAVANAEKNANKAIENLENAQREKQKIEDASNPQVIENAKQEVEVANQTVETARTSVENATAKLEEAKAFDKQLEVNIQNAKTTMDEALANKREKELHADELKVVSDKAQADLQKAQFENDDRYAGFPTDIKLDEGFVKAFKAWMDFTNFSNNSESYELYKTNPEEFNRQNQALHKAVLDAELRITNSPENRAYTVGQSVKETYAQPKLEKALNKATDIAARRMLDGDTSIPTYDSKNLPQELVNDLNTYGIELLNSIRSQFGLAPVSVNTNAVAMANDIANKVEDANFTTAGHYVSGISEVAEKYGLKGGKNYYENLLTTYNTRMVSKEELFANVAAAMIGFFYEGHIGGQNIGYLHAKSLYRGESGYGIGFSHTEKSNGDGVLKVHVISATRNTADAETLRTKWGNEAPYVLEPKGPIDLLALKQRADETLANYMRAKGELSHVATVYNHAKRSYEDLISTAVKTPTATNILTNAQKTLDEALRDQVAKLARLRELEALVSSNQVRLAEVTNAVEQAKKAKDLAEVTLITQRAKLHTATLAYDVAVKEQEIAAQKVEKVKVNIVKAKLELERLIQLTGEVEAKREAIKTMKEQLKHAKTQLERTKEIVAKTQENLVKVSKEWAALKERYKLQEIAKQPIVPDVVPKPDKNKETLAKGNETLSPITPIVTLKPTPPKGDVSSSKVVKPTTHNQKQESMAVLEEKVTNDKAETNQLTEKPTVIDQVATVQSTATKEAALPATGEVSMTWFTVASVSILTSLGLVLTTRAKKDH